MANKVWKFLIPPIYIDFIAEKAVHAQKILLKSFKQVRTTNDIANKTYKSTKSKEIKKL